MQRCSWIGFLGFSLPLLCMCVKCRLSMLLILPLYLPACFALLPSAFCCFTACVDVYGTHSNVHLRCFHTGKSAVMHATPKVSSVTIRHSLSGSVYPFTALAEFAIAQILAFRINLFSRLLFIFFL